MPAKIIKTPTLTCQKCGSVTNKMYSSRHPMNTHFGKIPWCQNCLEELYTNLFKQYLDHYKCMDLFCQIINIPFYDDLYTIAKARLEENNVAIYAGYLTNYSSAVGQKSYKGLYYNDSPKFIKQTTDEIDMGNIENYEDVEELLFFWGEGFEPLDYKYLEWDLEKWKQTHKCENRSEETLLKEICIKELEIRNARRDKSDTKDLIKELQALMKTAGADPAKANAISSGKLQETYGCWVKDIEQFTPAEWHENQEKYEDMDNLKSYIQNYIVRPIKNFVTGSRDFNIDYTESDNFDDGGDSSR